MRKQRAVKEGRPADIALTRHFNFKGGRKEEGKPKVKKKSKTGGKKDTYN
jgi:hypothetical protein